MSGSVQAPIFAERTCEYKRNVFSDTGGYWFMRCSVCNQQSNEHLVMADYHNYCCHCGARIVKKEGQDEWLARKERGEI